MAEMTGTVAKKGLRNVRVCEKESDEEGKEE